MTVRHAYIIIPTIFGSHGPCQPIRAHFDGHSLIEVWLQIVRRGIWNEARPVIEICSPVWEVSKIRLVAVMISQACSFTQAAGRVSRSMQAACRRPFTSNHWPFPLVKCINSNNDKGESRDPCEQPNPPFSFGNPPWSSAMDAPHVIMMCPNATGRPPCRRDVADAHTEDHITAV